MKQFARKVVSLLLAICMVWGLAGMLLPVTAAATETEHLHLECKAGYVLRISPTGYKQYTWNEGVPSTETPFTGTYVLFGRQSTNIYVDAGGASDVTINIILVNLDATAADWQGLMGIEAGVTVNLTCYGVNKVLGDNHPGVTEDGTLNVTVMENSSLEIGSQYGSTSCVGSDLTLNVLQGTPSLDLTQEGWRSNTRLKITNGTPAEYPKLDTVCGLYSCPVCSEPVQDHVFDASSPDVCSRCGQSFSDEKRILKQPSASDMTVYVGAYQDAAFQWYQDGQAVEGKTEASYGEVTEAGSYYCVVTWGDVTETSDTVILKNGIINDWGNGVEVTFPQSASFQWYDVTLSDVRKMVDKNPGTDEEAVVGIDCGTHTGSGVWASEDGELALYLPIGYLAAVRVTPSAGFDGEVFTYDGELVKNGDGTYTYTAYYTDYTSLYMADDADFTAKVEVIYLAANEPISGQTGSSLRKEILPGEGYVCQITWTNGDVAWTEPIYNCNYIQVQPTSDSLSVSVTNPQEAVYQWYQWLEEEEELQAMDGETAAVLSAPEAGGVYFCKVTWSLGYSEYSSVVEMDDVIAYLGDAGLTVDVADDLTPDGYQWYAVTLGNAKTVIDGTPGENEMDASSVWSGEYDAETGLWHPESGYIDAAVRVNPGDVVRITVSEGFTGQVRDYYNEYVFFQQGQAYLCEVPDDYLNFYVTGSGDFTVKVEVLTYEKGEAVQGATQAVYADYTVGDRYLCEVTVGETVLESNTVNTTPWIIQQPTAGDPTVVVTQANKAQYQWYEYKGLGEEITDENAVAVTQENLEEFIGQPADATLLGTAAYGENGWTGMYIRNGDYYVYVYAWIELKAGEAVTVVPSDGIEQVALSGMNAQCTQSYDLLGNVVLTAPKDGVYLLAALSYSADQTVRVYHGTYTGAEALEGQTGKTLNKNGLDGVYFCRVTYNENVYLDSDAVVVDPKQAGNAGTGDTMALGKMMVLTVVSGLALAGLTVLGKKKRI